MALTFRAATTAGNASGSPLAINKPTGTVDGDLVIAQCYWEGNGQIIVPPSGWRLIRKTENTATTPDFQITTFYKIASSEPASWTFTPSVLSQWRTITCTAWSGASGSGWQVDASNGTTAGLSFIDVPSVTTTATNETVLALAGTLQGVDMSYTTGLCSTVRAQLGGVEQYSGTQATAAATGATRLGAGNADYAGHHVAFKDNSGTPSTYSIQPDETSAVDTYTQEDTPSSTVRDTDTALNHESDAGTRCISLLKPDLSGLPGYTELIGAELEVWTNASRASGNARAMTIRRIRSVNSGWTEDANWNFADGSSVRWAGDTDNNGGANAGCSVEGTDYETTVMGSYSIAVSEAAGTRHVVWLDPAELASLLANNYGVAIVAHVAGLDVSVRSSNHATSGERPKWTILYVASSGTSYQRSLTAAMPAATATPARVLGALRSLTASQPASSAALSRIHGRARALTAALPAASAALASQLQALRALAASLPAPSAALTRLHARALALTAALPAPSASLARVHARLRALVAAMPAASATLTSQSVIARALTAAMPAATAALGRVHATVRGLTAALPAPSAALARIHARALALTASLPAASASLSRAHARTRALLAAMPSPSATLARVHARALALLAALPAPTATLARVQALIRSLTAAQPAATATLGRVQNLARSLAAALPSATAVVDVGGALTRFLTAAMPAASATLGRQVAAARSLSADLPAPSAVLARVHARALALLAAMPAPSALLSNRSIVTRFLTAAMPAASASLAQTAARFRALTAALPAPTASLGRVAALARSLTASLPGATASLGRRLSAVRSLLASLPAAVAALLVEITTGAAPMRVEVAAYPVYRLEVGAGAVYRTVAAGLPVYRAEVGANPAA